MREHGPGDSGYHFQVDRIDEPARYWSEARTVDGVTFRHVAGWNPQSRRFFLDTYRDGDGAAGERPTVSSGSASVSAATYEELVRLVAGGYDGVEFTSDYGEDYRGQRADELRLLETHGERLRADRLESLGISAAEEAAGVLDTGQSEEGNTEYRLAPGSRNPTRPFFGYDNEVRVGWDTVRGEYYFSVRELLHEGWGDSSAGREIASACAPDLGALDEKLCVYAVLPDQVRARLEADRSRSNSHVACPDGVRLEFAMARDAYDRAARAWRNREAPFESLMDAFGVYARATGRLLEEEGSLDALREALERPRTRSSVVLDAVYDYAEARGLASRLEREVRSVGTSERPTFVGHHEKAYFARRAAVLDGWRDPQRVWSREDYDVFGEWSPERRDFAHQIGYGLARDRVERAREALVSAVPVYGRSLVARLENGRRNERLAEGDLEEFSSHRDSDRARIAVHVAGVLRGIEAENREISGHKAAVGHDNPIARSLPKLILVRQAVERAAQFAVTAANAATVSIGRELGASRGHGIGQA